MTTSCRGSAWRTGIKLKYSSSGMLEFWKRPKANRLNSSICRSCRKVNPASESTAGWDVASLSGRLIVDRTSAWHLAGNPSSYWRGPSASVPQPFCPHHLHCPIWDCKGAILTLAISIYTSINRDISSSEIHRFHSWYALRAYTGLPWQPKPQCDDDHSNLPGTRLCAAPRIASNLIRLKDHYRVWRYWMLNVANRHVYITSSVRMILTSCHG